LSKTAVTQTNIEGVPLKRGKVRDVYDLGDRLLLVATDRISAYDSVMPNGIPDKGKILTGMSIFWFDFLKDITKNHLISCDVASLGSPIADHISDLEGRTMITHKAKVLPVECVVRGYLAGSAWADYEKTGKAVGMDLPAGMKESQKLPEPTFTPATKAEEGHDENIDFKGACEIIGVKLAEEVRHRSIEIYLAASDYAASRGVIIADTKFEWGMVGDELILVDEVFTPDSSRFWPADDYEIGRSQASFDKQFVRDWLTSSGWDRNPPAPMLPDDVVMKTREKYCEAYQLVVGKPFEG